MGTDVQWLYRLTGKDWAVVSDRATLESCECSTCGHAVVAISDGNCAGSPDLDTCAGRWHESLSPNATHSLSTNPAIAVSGCSAACCDIDCGAHGTLGDGVTTHCTCTCSGGYSGHFCQLAPSYIVSGATPSRFNGQYDQLQASQCNGNAVYQLGGEGGYVLYQPAGMGGLWAVGESAMATSCGTVAALVRYCSALSPDDSSCGAWSVACSTDPYGWCDDDSVVVTRG